MFKLDLEKAEEQEIKLLTSVGSSKSKTVPKKTNKQTTTTKKNIYFCFTDYVKTFDCVDHNRQWKILKEIEIPDHLDLTPEKSVCRSRSKS